MPHSAAARSKAGRCLALVVSLTLSVQAMARETLPDAAARERLLAGEVVLERRDGGGGGAGASVSILARSPVEALWAVVVSCADARAFVSGLRECEVIEDDGDYAVTRQVVDKGWLTPRLKYTFEIRRERYRRMDFGLVDGNLKQLRGSWTFTPWSGGLLVRHELVLEPQVPAPRWLVRRNVLNDLPDMLRCIRALAGGSLAPDQAEADRRACAEPPALQ